MAMAMMYDDDEREDEDRATGHDLVDEQVGTAAEEQPVGADAGCRRVGEQAEHDRAEQAADEVDGDHVEAVVEPEDGLDPQREVAHDRRRRSR